MTQLDMYLGVGISSLILLATGWYIKLTIEVEHMDVIGFGVVMLVLGFVAGVKL